ncbi:unnamed protein product [Owenia fusiformis]|uniref:Pleckstrin homology domain-containing family M member 2 n=1 Tax=Owenia fusiformis TaxID=6347 RepID=A0A8S4N262_OWEFU|nr:unnamed protein product [Owenia fusiformis]
MAKPFENVELKDKIVEKISKAVKHIQSKCNSGEDVVTLGIEDWQVHKLCQHLDHALLHGLKNITNGYWKLSVEFTHKDIIKEIKALKQVTTNLGRGRAWMYHALNDCLLESYLRLVGNSTKFMKKVYLKEALMLDQERLEVLVTLLSGLEHAVFQLDMNQPYLDLSSYRPTPTKEDDVKPESDDSSSTTSSHLAQEMAIGPERSRSSSATSVSSSRASDSAFVYSASSPGLTESRIHRVSSIMSDDIPGEGDNVLEVIRVKRRGSKLKKSRSRSSRSCSDSVSVHSNRSRGSFNEGIPSIHEDSHNQEFETGDNPNEDDPGITFKAHSNVEDVQSAGDPSGDPMGDQDQEGDQARGPAGIENDALERLVTKVEDSVLHDINVTSNEKDNEVTDATKDAIPKEIKDKTQSMQYEHNRNPEMEQSAIEESHDETDNAVQNIDVIQNILEDQSPTKINEMLNHVIENTQGAYIKDNSKEHDDNASADKLETSADFTSIYSNPKDTPEKPKPINRSQYNPHAKHNLNEEFEEIDTKPNDADTDSIEKDIYNESGYVSKASDQTESDLESEGSQQAQSSLVESDQHDNERIEEHKGEDIKKPHPAVIELDNNMKLHLMLNVFQSENEQFTKMFALTQGHTEGQLETKFLLLTSIAIYILHPKMNNLDLDRRIAFREIDFISLSMGYQVINIVCTNRRKQVWLCTGDYTLTRLIMSSLDGCLKVCGDDLARVCILSDATTQIISMRKYAAQDAKSELNEVSLKSYSLVHWQDLQPERYNTSNHSGILLHKTVQANSFIANKSKWKPGYFELRNGTLFQYTDANSTQSPILAVHLGGEECLGCRRSTQSDRDHSFEVILSNGNILVLAAANGDDIQQWLMNLCQAVAQKHIEKKNNECMACCLVLTNSKILMCHEDPQTHFFRTLGSADVTDVSQLLQDTGAATYVILDFESSDSSVSKEQWVVYFNCQEERNRFTQTLSETWAEHFKVAVPVTQLCDISVQKQCREQVKQIRQLIYGDIAQALKTF